MVYTPGRYVFDYIMQGSLYTSKEQLDGHVGVYSVAVHTEQYKGNCKNLGWFNPGVFIYQLTMEPSTTQVEGGGTIQFTTSIEAVITCDEKSIVPRQIDTLTWEATLPPDESDTYLFTATADEEYVVCSVRDKVE